MLDRHVFDHMGRDRHPRTRRTRTLRRCYRSGWVFCRGRHAHHSDTRFRRSKPRLRGKRACDCPPVTASVREHPAESRKKFLGHGVSHPAHCDLAATCAHQGCSQASEAVFASSRSSRSETDAIQSMVGRTPSPGLRACRTIDRARVEGPTAGHLCLSRELVILLSVQPYGQHVRAVATRSAHRGVTGRCGVLARLRVVGLVAQHLLHPSRMTSSYGSKMSSSVGRT